MPAIARACTSVVAALRLARSCRNAIGLSGDLQRVALRGPTRASFGCVLALCAIVAGCATTPTFPPAAPSTGKRSPPIDREFELADVAKADVDSVAELHSRECLASVRLLMEKLYRRNPRELRKGNFGSIDAALARAFDPRAQFRFAELKELRGSEAIDLALKADYQGDRVFAFGVGLASTVFLSYNGRTAFYLTDSLDPQKLYNAARNIEIAAWKLASTRDASGEPVLLSNGIEGDVRNLSFEREFGKMIAYQDVMAEIAAGRTNRTIRHVLQGLATAVFLPL